MFQQKNQESKLSIESINELPSDIEESLRNHPLFRKSGDDTIRELCKVMKSRIYLSGDKIIQEGDEGKAIFFLIRGEVDILSSDDEIVYATLYSGSFFGEIALLKNVNRTANVLARSKCFVLCLHKQDYLDFKNLELWTQLEDEASTRLEALNNKKLGKVDEIPEYNSNIIPGNTGNESTNSLFLDEELICKALKKFPPFQFCDGDSLSKIFQLLKTIRFQPGEINLNDASPSILMVLNGIVSSSISDEIRKKSFAQNEFYGALNLNNRDTLENETLLALSAGTACILESRSVLALMESNADVREQIELSFVKSLEHSLENLMVSEEKSSKSNLSKSFDSQRLMVTSGEKRRASIAVWADPTLSKLVERKKSGQKLSNLNIKSKTNNIYSELLNIALEKPKIFRCIIDFLRFRDIFTLSSVCQAFYDEISKLATICVNIDLCEYQNSMNNAGLNGISELG
eukprot:NODE_64_length_26047_cov_1.706837.p5 type:complete len:460 gc:universal NODE_64_length_26047_cov_1.706837:15842-14463(-)